MSASRQAALSLLLLLAVSCCCVSGAAANRLLKSSSSLPSNHKAAALNRSQALPLLPPVNSDLASPNTSSTPNATFLLQQPALNASASTSTSSRRVGNLCSRGGPPGSVHCHAKVLLANEYSTASAPEGATALNLAFRPDMSHVEQSGPGHALNLNLSHSQRHLQQSGPSGYSPKQLQQVYLGSKAASKCQKIAIVDAYASRTAQSDLNKYRSTFGLPAISLQQFDQDGHTLQTSSSSSPGYVPYDAGWAGEQMLDLDMASAMCPCCPIMYVGARSSGMGDLAAAVKRAVALGAAVVSMSWGAGEFGTNADDASLFNFPGIAFTASSGDDGHTGASYPASSAYVTAVGGTTLHLDSNNNRASETAWKGAGSGCSGSLSKPAWQKDTGCSKRMATDVSAVADPNTGVAVYVNGAWTVLGGTSVAAPIIGGMYAGGYLGGGGFSIPARSLYAGGPDHQLLYDVSSGSTGSCGGNYFCNAGQGFDGPTGNGSPNIGAGSNPGPGPGPSPSGGSHFPGGYLVYSSDRLTNQYLPPNSCIQASAAAFRLCYQTDGNVVIYTSFSGPTWASNKFSSAPGRTVMQSDGNLVAYDANNRPYWASNTMGTGGTTLIMQSDGNLVIYKADLRTAVWASNTVTPH